MGWEDDFVQILENVVVDGNNGDQDEPVACECARKGLCCDNEACFNFSTQMECVNCSNPRCKNQRMQRRQNAKMEVRETPMKHGYGLFAGEDIKAGQFILEFLGEVITKRTMEERCKANGRSQLYLHNVGNNLYLDATKQGCIARYTNHSCEPNASHNRWIVKGKLCIGVFAEKDIAKGEEFSFDYQWKLNNLKPTRCHCGTASCRGFLEDLTEEQKAFYTVRKGVWRKSEDALEEYENLKSSKPFYEWLVEKRVRVFWSGNNRFWDANVEAWDAKAKAHRVWYIVDSKNSTEQLLSPENLSKLNSEVKWEWLDESKEEEGIKKRGVAAAQLDEEEIIVDQERQGNTFAPIVLNPLYRPASPRSATPTANMDKWQEEQRASPRMKTRKTIEVKFVTAQYVVQQSMTNAISAAGFNITHIHDEEAVYDRTLELLRSYMPAVRCHRAPSESASPSRTPSKGKSSSMQVILFGDEDKVNIAMTTFTKSEELRQNLERTRTSAVQGQLSGLQSPALLYDWRLLPSMVDINAFGTGNMNAEIAAENAALAHIWRCLETSPQLMQTPLVCPLSSIPDTPTNKGSSEDSDASIASRKAFQTQSLSESVRKSLLGNLRKSGSRLKCFSMTTLHAATILLRYLSFSFATDAISREATPLITACVILAEKARGNFTPSHVERVVKAVYCDVFGREEAVGNVQPFIERSARMEESILQVLKFDIYVPDVLGLVYSRWTKIENIIHDLWIFGRHVGNLHNCGSLGVSIATTFPRLWQALLPEVAILVSLIVDCVACELAEHHVYGGDKALKPQNLFYALWQVGSFNLHQTAVQMHWAIIIIASATASLPVALQPEWFTEMAEDVSRRMGTLDWAGIVGGVAGVVEHWMNQGMLLNHQLKPDMKYDVFSARPYRTRLPWLDKGASTESSVTSGGLIDANKGSADMTAISKDMFSCKVPSTQWPLVTDTPSKGESVRTSLRQWPTERVARKEAAYYKAANLDKGNSMSGPAVHELCMWQQVHYFSGLHSIRSTHRRNDMLEEPVRFGELFPHARPAVSPYVATVVGISTLNGSFHLPKFSKSSAVDDDSRNSSSSSASSHVTPAKEKKSDSTESETDFLRSITINSSPRSIDGSPREGAASPPLRQDSGVPQRFLALAPVNVCLETIVNLIPKTHGKALLSPGLAVELCRDLFCAVDHLNACGIVLRYLDPSHFYITPAGILVLANMAGAVASGGGALASGIPAYIRALEIERERAREASRKHKKDKRRHRKRVHDGNNDHADEHSYKKSRKGEDKFSSRSSSTKDKESDVKRTKEKPVKVSKPSLPYLASTAPEIILGDVASSRSSLYSAACICLFILAGRNIVKSSDTEDQHMQNLYKVLGTPTKETSDIQRYFAELPLQATYGVHIQTPEGPQSSRSRAFKTLAGILPQPLKQQLSCEMHILRPEGVSDEEKLLDEFMSDNGLAIDMLRGCLMLAPQKRYETAEDVLNLNLFTNKFRGYSAAERASETSLLCDNIKTLMHKK